MKNICQTITSLKHNYKKTINKHKIALATKYTTYNSSQQVEKISERLVISPWSVGYQV